MKTIYKYELSVSPTVELVLPVGAQILSFQTQQQKPCVWAIVDTTVDVETRHFALAGTGTDVEELLVGHKYIGTTQMAGGALVWHLFEKLA